MPSRLRWALTYLAVFAIVLLPLTSNLFAQDDVPAGSAPHPGGYLSVGKLAAIAFVFLLWVRMADWINRDSMKIGEKMGMLPETWNPIVAFSFLVGFMCAISVPMFVVGYPIFIVTALLPFTLYFFTRRGKIKANPNLVNILKQKPGMAPIVEKLPQDEGVEVDFTPAGADKSERQANYIRARQTIGYGELKELIVQSQFKRTEQLLMDYTRDIVNLRILVDGTWHALEPLDREKGDAVLESLKHLAGMNARERRARQNGKFKIKSELGKAELLITTQGVPTGERAQVKFMGNAAGLMNLSQLGMFPDKVKLIKDKLDTPGMNIVSAPQGEGLTSTWRGTLATADRLTRDCVAIIDSEDQETRIENIVVQEYDEKTSGKDQLSIAKTTILTQPDLLVCSKVENAETMDLLTKQVLKDDRSLVLQTSAKSASEALLRMYAKAGNREQFMAAVNNVTCQRLVRRLCDSCKVQVRVPPQVIQKLGGNPKTQQTIYDQWKLPPPEQRVDENGKAIEFPPCPACGGIGYIGRIAVFETITMNDELRQMVAKKPKIEAVEAAATKMGKLPLANEAYKLVLLGVTSLPEVQSMLKKK